MEKIVKSGERVTHVTLDGTECAVRFSAEYRVFYVKSEGSEVLVSLRSGAVRGDDGTLICPSGGSVGYPHMRHVNTVYLTGTGDVTVFAGNEADAAPFKSAAQGGGDDISASGNPVILSGLQGGVPFSEIKLTGDIIGKELKVAACGKNLYEGSQDWSGIWINDEFWTTADETYNGLTVKTKTAAWGGLRKSIYVFAGKTYTFSCFIKCGVDNTLCSLYIASGTDDTMAQPNNVAAGVYITTEWQRYEITFTCTKSGWINPRAELREDGIDIFVCGYQLEEAASATEYEPYGGVIHTLTPDSNPYIIPVDISQQDGLNIVSVNCNSAVLTVTGAKKSDALKKIWNSIFAMQTAIIAQSAET